MRTTPSPQIVADGLRTLRTFAATTSLLLLSACIQAEPTIDVSSEEAFQSSIAEMEADMGPEQNKRFKDALEAIAFSELKMADVLAGNDPTEQFFKSLQSVDGFTASEVIEAAEALPQGNPIRDFTEEMTKGLSPPKQ